MLKIHGLTVQNIIELEMINYKGEVLIANNQTNSVLFRALRGAGGGSFGIVTKIKLILYKAPRQIQRLEQSYKFSDFTRVFRKRQSLQMATVARNVFCYFSMGKNNIININYFEFNQNVLSPIPDEFLPSNFATESTRSEINYFEFLKVAEAIHTFPLAGYFNVTHHSFPHYYWKIKSIYVRKPIEKQGARKLMKILETKPIVVAFFLMPYGGAVYEFGARDKYLSFIHTSTDILYLLAISCRGPGTSTTQEEFENGLRWIESAFQQVEFEILRDMYPQIYQNYIDLDLVDYLQRYYGSSENIKELVRVKNKYDPENYFHNEQSIPLWWP